MQIRLFGLCCQFKFQMHYVYVYFLEQYRFKFKKQQQSQDCVYSGMTTCENSKFLTNGCWNIVTAGIQFTLYMLEIPHLPFLVFGKDTLTFLLHIIKTQTQEGSKRTQFSCLIHNRLQVKCLRIAWHVLVACV